MWSKYTGVLIWKTQNPWTGLRGQFYDHLHEQTAGFYGCRCAAEPIHVQLNLSTYLIEVVNINFDIFCMQYLQGAPFPQSSKFNMVVTQEHVNTHIFLYILYSLKWIDQTPCYGIVYFDIPQPSATSTDFGLRTYSLIPVRVDES